MDNYERDIIEQLKDKLTEYLLGQGVSIRSNGFFKCIHPDHEDNNPSCSISGGHNQTLFHCFSCGIAGDIFHAANYLEGMPIGDDPEFYVNTLKVLADRFNIEYEPRQLNEDERARMTLRRAFRDASDVLTGLSLKYWDTEGSPADIIKERDISKDMVIDFGIGSIANVDEYKNAMIGRGWKEDWLIDNWLLDKPSREVQIFQPGKIIMTIKDANGRPIAFVSRKANWKKGDKDGKYVNPPTSIIYKKAYTLFGFDLAKENIRRKPLILVEGYIDVIKLRQAGVKNVAGLGSATFDTEVLDLIHGQITKKGHEIKHIVLCFDNDQGGQDCTRRSIEQLGTRSNIAVEVKEIPTGFKDPDDIIKRSGKKFFDSIKRISTFKWLLKNKKEEEPEQQFVRRVCKDIANEDSPVSRRTMATDLAELVQDFTVTDIVAQINHERGEKSSKMQSQMEGIFAILDKKRRSSNGGENIKIAQECLNSLKNIQRDHNQRHGDPQKRYEQLINETIVTFNNTQRLNGFKLKRFPQMEHALDGFPDKECLISVAGDSNIGKSTWVREISWDIAQSNEDAIVMYMSIDDTTRDVLQAIVARECKEARNKVYKVGFQPADIQDKVMDGWNKVEKQKNYIVVDSTSGSTLMHLQDHIEYMKREYPNKRPILFLDNFHKLRSTAGPGQGMREKFHETVQMLKDITQEHDIPIVMTVELRKGDGKKNRQADMENIAETKQIEYDSKVIFMCHQQMHYDPDTSMSWIRDTYSSDNLTQDGQVKMPYLQAWLSKNKHTDVKKPFAYKFETDRSILMEVPYDEYKSREQQDKERLYKKRTAA